MGWKQFLKQKTHQADFLWRMSITILVAGLVISFIADWLNPKPDLRTLVESSLNEGTDSEEESDTSTGDDAEDHPWDRVEQMAAAGRWLDAWWAIPGTQLWRFGAFGTATLALLACAVWMVFMWQACRISGRQLVDVSAALLALAMGGLSIWPNAFFSLWQEYEWGIRESAELVDGIKYFVLGVGLREETAKLLCFLPFIPWLLRRRSDLTALWIASCVGLGFAFVENTGYYAATQGRAVTSRLLTANPAHMVLTGIAGLTVYRATRSPADWGSHALATFLLMVAAHGMYDASIAVPDMQAYSIIGMIIFVMLVYRFFGELRELKPHRVESVSLTSTFLFGVTLLTAAACIYVSWTDGRRVAIDMLAADIGGLGVIVYLFLRELPESIA